MRAEEAQGPRQQRGRSPHRPVSHGRTSVTREFDPEESNNDTEENSQLLGAIIENIRPFSFTAVGRSGGNDEGVRSLVDARDQGRERLLRRRFVDVVATPRIGGKFASVRLTTDVQSPEMIRASSRSCAPSSAVKMAF